MRKQANPDLEAMLANENKRLKAVQFYLSVSNTTDRIVRVDFSTMAENALKLAVPSLGAEDRQAILNVGAELLDFSIGIAASAPVDVFQSITGKHYRTWENLSELDHALSMASVMTLGVGGASIRGVKAVARISEYLYGAGHAVLVRMPVFNRFFDTAIKYGFDLRSLKGSSSTGDKIIVETLASPGRNITSNFAISSNEATEMGLKWLGDGYKELDRGVYRSMDNFRQFRMDGNSLDGAHAPFVPHVHLETYTKSTGKFDVNNHIRLSD
jgi:hypothetical protein